MFHGQVRAFPALFREDPRLTCVFSVLFLMFPEFLVVEDIGTTRALRPYASWQEIQNTGNAKKSFDENGNKLGTRSGTLGT